MHRDLLLLLTSGVLVVAGAAQAQQAQPDPGKFKAAFASKFEQMDTDKNGSVSIEEFKASNTPALLQSYMKYDKDGNKAVSASECIPAMVSEGVPSDKAKANFAEFDTNKDGSYDESEAAAFIKSHLESQFKLWDADGNGSLSKEEFVNKAMDDMMKLLNRNSAQN